MGAVLNLSHSGESVSFDPHQKSKSWSAARNGRMALPSGRFSSMPFHLKAYCLYKLQSLP